MSSAAGSRLSDADAAATLAVIARRSAAIRARVLASRAAEMEDLIHSANECAPVSAEVFVRELLAEAD